MFPDKDSPLFQNGFIACITLQAVCIVTYLCLPILLIWEAEGRKKKTGHAMPLRAIIDAENAQASDATIAHLHAIQQQEAAMHMKQLKVDGDANSQHVEDLEQATATK